MRPSTVPMYESSKPWTIFLSLSVLLFAPKYSKVWYLGAWKMVWIMGCEIHAPFLSLWWNGIQFSACQKWTGLSFLFFSSCLSSMWDFFCVISIKKHQVSLKVTVIRNFFIPRMRVRPLFLCRIHWLKEKLFSSADPSDLQLCPQFPQRTKVRFVLLCVVRDIHSLSGLFATEAM